MEKKNTMLLTVIAVATLLVAVVGATFAFFSLSVTSGAQTTATTVTAPEIGTATILNKQTNLSLSVTAQDMAKQGEDVKYYASAGTGGVAPGSSDMIPIAQMDYNGGTTGTSYKCPVQVEVIVNGNMLENLQAGWTQLILQGEAVNGEQGTESGPRTLDLVTLKKTGEELQQTKSQVYKGKVTVTGATMAAKDILSASLYLDNKQEEDQKDIADKTLTVTVKVTPDGACALQS